MSKANRIPRQRQRWELGRQRRRRWEVARERQRRWEQEQDSRAWFAMVMLDTWEEFLQAGAKTLGFREGRWHTLTKTKVGDRLFIYVAGINRFVAIYEVISEPKIDRQPIWS